MPGRPTQRDRVLAALKAAGSVGLHTHDMRGEPLWIGNPSQRINELADAGHEIEHKRERRNDSPGTRYTLKTAGGEGVASRDAAPVLDHPSTGSPSPAQVEAPPAVQELLVDDQAGEVHDLPSAFDPWSEAA